MSKATRMMTMEALGEGRSRSPTSPHGRVFRTSPGVVVPRGLTYVSVTRPVSGSVAVDRCLTGPAAAGAASEAISGTSGVGVFGSAGEASATWSSSARVRVTPPRIAARGRGPRPRPRRGWNMRRRRAPGTCEARAIVAPLGLRGGDVVGPCSSMSLFRGSEILTVRF